MQVEILNRKSVELDRIAENIGNTPLQKIWTEGEVEIFAKVEWEQLGGSVKARAAYRIIKDSVEKGELHSGRSLLDATSGNTGIAYAAIGQQLGLNVVIVIPENASEERIQILRSLGATLIFTSRFGSTDEAQEKAKEMADKFPDKYYYADQYNNPQNWLAHYNTTAPEIWEQTAGSLTHFICGLGTTGTFTGTSKWLKENAPNVRTIALQPETALHGLEGWKHLQTAKVPGIYFPSLPDRIEEVSTLEAYHWMRVIRDEKGLELSPSSAANLSGAIASAKKLTGGKIVTILPDNADKYGEIVNQILN